MLQNTNFHAIRNYKLKLFQIYSVSKCVLVVSTRGIIGLITFFTSHLCTVNLKGKGGGFEMQQKRLNTSDIFLLKPMKNLTSETNFKCELTKEEY